MRKQVILKVITIGLIVGMLIIQPLVVLLHMFDTQGGQSSWWNYPLASFSNIVAIGDIDQVLINLLYGLLGY